MSMWDKPVNGPWDEFFDKNKDGMLNPAEQALQYEIWREIVEPDEDEDYDSDPWDDDDGDDL